MIIKDYFYLDLRETILKRLSEPYPDSPTFIYEEEEEEEIQEDDLFEARPVNIFGHELTIYFPKNLGWLWLAILLMILLLLVYLLMKK